MIRRPGVPRCSIHATFTHQPVRPVVGNPDFYLIATGSNGRCDINAVWPGPGDTAMFAVNINAGNYFYCAEIKLHCPGLMHIPVKVFL